MTRDGLKATPGPWEALLTDSETHAVVSPMSDDTRPWFTAIIQCADEAVEDANAHLIASAPELYEDGEFLCARIRELEGDLDDDSDAARQFFGHVIPALARMESALRKARGEQP
jgi:hypothetical protein